MHGETQLAGPWGNVRYFKSTPGVPEYWIVRDYRRNRKTVHHTLFAAQDHVRALSEAYQRRTNTVETRRAALIRNTNYGDW